MVLAGGCCGSKRRKTIRGKKVSFLQLKIPQMQQQIYLTGHIYSENLIKSGMITCKKLF